MKAVKNIFEKTKEIYEKNRRDQWDDVSMNKNQWGALAICFMMCGLGFMGIYELFNFRISDTTADPFTLYNVIVQGIATILVYVCLMSAVICAVCGWLEREEAK